jgi:hypothetical protein
MTDEFAPGRIGTTNRRGDDPLAHLAEGDEFQLNGHRCRCTGVRALEPAERVGPMVDVDRWFVVSYEVLD